MGRQHPGNRPCERPTRFPHATSVMDWMTNPEQANPTTTWDKCRKSCLFHRQKYTGKVRRASSESSLNKIANYLWRRRRKKRRKLVNCPCLKKLSFPTLSVWVALLDTPPPDVLGSPIESGRLDWIPTPLFCQQTFLPAENVLHPPGFFSSSPNQGCVGPSPVEAPWHVSSATQV